MKAKVQQGRIVFRQLTEKSGLEESSQNFQSLDELFQRVLSAKEPLLVDRISIQGFDENGNERVVSFVFQSITISDTDPE